MPSFGSDDDRLLQTTIEKWKQTALGEFYSIEAWRESPDEARRGYQCRHLSGPTREREREQYLYWFLSNTTHLIAEAVSLSLDPRPLQVIYDAVNVWNHERGDEHVPGQSTLQAALDSALLVVFTIEDGIRRRMVREKPGTAPAEEHIPTPAPVGPVEPEGPDPGPLERTCQALGKRADKQVALVRFLDTRERRTAGFETLVSGVYKVKCLSKAQQRKAERNARRHAERTRKNLDHKRCPLRLHIGDSVVKLIDAE